MQHWYLVDFYAHRMFALKLGNLFRACGCCPVRTPVSCLAMVSDLLKDALVMTAATYQLGMPFDSDIPLLDSLLSA